MLTRTLGHFPVSVATSLALEVAYGTGTAPVEQPVSKNQLLKYEGVWINIRTMARNIYSAVASEQKDNITHHDITEALDQEMDALNRIPASMNDPYDFMFYYCTHASLHKRLKHAQFREPTTPKQIHQAECIDKGIANFLKDIRKREKELASNPEHKDYQSNVLEFDLAVEPFKRTNTVLLTHHMLDFVHHEKFKQLTLLESHTGALKMRDRWYTKFTNGRDMPFVPFNAATLQFFGDSDMFKPFKQEARAEIQNISKERNWTATTTDDRFLLGLDLSKNKFLTATARDMIRSI